MKFMHKYREFALKHLSIMYRSEHQFLIYLQVFTNKTKTEKLKDLLFDLKQSSNYKLNFLHQILKTLKNPCLEFSSEAINGLFKETFRMIDDEENPVLIETTVLHALNMASHYKIGNYTTLLFYFRALDLDKETDLMQKIIHAEVAIQKRINTLLTNDFLNHVFNPKLEKNLVSYKSQSHEIH